MHISISFPFFKRILPIPPKHAGIHKSATYNCLTCFSTILARLLQIHDIIKTRKKISSKHNEKFPYISSKTLLKEENFHDI